MNKKQKVTSDISTEQFDDRPVFGWRRKLFIIIFEADTPYGRTFDLALLWAILISIILVILESDKGINNDYGHIIKVIEYIITIFFTIEYLLRLTITRHPKKYAKSFFGIVDLLSVLPTYIAFFLPQTQFLMVIRVLRLLRVFRILKLVRFVNAAAQLADALYQSRFKIYIFFGAVGSLVLIMGSCMYIVEGEQSGFSSILKSMYWTVVTMTTVGYGDMVPQTVMGKFVASMMMLIGYTIIAVPTGIVSAELMNTEKKKRSFCKRCKTIIPVESNYCLKCGEEQ